MAIRLGTMIAAAALLLSCGGDAARRPSGVRPLAGFTTGPEWADTELLERVHAHERRLEELAEETTPVTGEPCFPDPRRVPSTLRCRVAEDTIYFEPPYLPWGRSPLIPTERGLFEVQIGWTAASQVVDGELIAEAVERHADHSDVSCEGVGDSASCSIFLRGHSGDTEVLQECRLAKIEGVPGAPEDCRVRAIVVEGEPQLPVMLSVAPGRPPPRDASTLLSVNVVRRDTPVRGTLFLLARGALEEEPLALTVHRRDALAGVANRRRSEVLQGWWETLTVRVNVSYRERRVDNRNQRVATIHVNPIIYVSRRNSDRARDWRLPSESQLREYRQTILGNLKSRLERLCDQRQWPDAQTLECRD